MNQINVGLADRSYPISIGVDILQNLGAALDAVKFPSKIAIVTH